MCDLAGVSVGDQVIFAICENCRFGAKIRIEMPGKLLKIYSCFAIQENVSAVHTKMSFNMHWWLYFSAWRKNQAHESDN